MIAYFEIKGDYYNLSHVSQIHRTGKTVFVQSPNWDKTIQYTMDSEEEAVNKTQEIEALRG